jgi:large subunit ribosomal protein L17
LRGLAVSLIERGKIATTEAKAKELRPFVERLVTHGKTGTVSARRQVSSTLGEPSSEIITKLFDTIAKGYLSRSGGYTRIIKIGRTEAGRDEAVIEFV